jgi:hypothetical protein
MSFVFFVQLFHSNSKDQCLGLPKKPTGTFWGRNLTLEMAQKPYHEYRLKYMFSHIYLLEKIWLHTNFSFLYFSSLWAHFLIRSDICLSQLRSRPCFSIKTKGPLNAKIAIDRIESWEKDVMWQNGCELVKLGCPGYRLAMMSGS